MRAASSWESLESEAREGGNCLMLTVAFGGFSARRLIAVRIRVKVLSMSIILEARVSSSLAWSFASRLAILSDAVAGVRLASSGGEV